MGWKKKAKKALKKVTPPILVDIYSASKRENALIGGFASWKEAEAKAEGYDKKSIFEKAKKAALAVKNGQALFERDTVLFFEPSYSHPISVGFLMAAAKAEGGLKILDFGGALGSTYFNFRPLLAGMEGLQWGVIEQEHFVKFGQEKLVDKRLSFYTTPSAYRSTIGAPDLALFSASIQYLENYVQIISEVISLSPKMVVLDRVPILRDRGAQKKVLVQKVSEPIYEASYPCWAFNRDEFLGHFRDYRLVLEAVCEDVVDKEVEYLSFVLERK